MTHSPVVRLLLIGAIVALATALHAQGPSPELRARLDGFFKALASGDAAAYEAMAKESFAPDYYARRTAEERRQFVERVTADFGRLEMRGVKRAGPDSVILVVSGDRSPMTVQVTLTIGAAPPHHISGVAFEVDDAPASALPAPPIDGSMTREALRAALDPWLQRLAADDVFSGAVLIARDGVVLYEQAAGLADRDRGVANTTATRFNIGSINKAFTKVAIGQLLAQKKLALTDTLGAILPDYPNVPARAATVAQLVEHTAGLGDFFGPAFDAADKSRFRSNADYVAFVAQQPIKSQPGERREYCNACYIVLGGIVEKVSGMRYEEYIAKHVFAPAGMTGAGFFASDANVPAVARGYTRGGPGRGASGPLRSNITMHGATGSAAGGGYATVADLLAFDRALRGGKLLDPAMTDWYYGGPGRNIGIGGGAPGINAVLEGSDPWTVVVGANLDPPAAQNVGMSIMGALRRSSR